VYKAVTGRVKVALLSCLHLMDGDPRGMVGLEIVAKTMRSRKLNSKTYKSGKRRRQT
jgi:hypothetical protein